MAFFPRLVTSFFQTSTKLSQTATRQAPRTLVNVEAGSSLPAAGAPVSSRAMGLVWNVLTII